MKWNLVIFDLDGTLIDTIRDLGEAVNFCLRQAGYPEHPMEKYNMMVGNGIRNLVKAALPEDVRGNDAVVDERLAVFVDYYTTHIDVYTRPYEGMQQILRTLAGAGVKVGVASNKFQAGTEKLVRAFFGDIPFVAILGNLPGQALKPDPAIVNICRERAGMGNDGTCGEAGVVMVGDSAVDMKTAANAGIPSIGVTWGFRTEEELLSCGATFIAHNSAELLALL